MKHMVCLILVCSLFLTGCSIIGEHIKEPVTFYYVRESYQKDMMQVIDSEVREASGHREDLTYLLALYSMGPSRKDLKSPLPRNTTIVPIARSDDSIELQLSENSQNIKDADLTLASACIALTCMELTNVQQVTVTCGERTITLKEDNLLLFYSSEPSVQEETK